MLSDKIFFPDNADFGILPLMPDNLEQGVICEILIAEKRGGHMSSLDEVEAVAGRGLVGDRHFRPADKALATNNVTLIELEKIEEFSNSADLFFSAHDARRNLVTRGISLNELVGTEFQVGPVRLKAIELCEPCSYLAKRTHRSVLRGLLNRGGLRCQVVTGGRIRLGDTITQS